MMKEKYLGERRGLITGRGSIFSFACVGSCEGQNDIRPCQMTNETGNGGANLRLCCGTRDSNQGALRMSFCMVNLPARHPGFSVSCTLFFRSGPENLV